MSVLDSIFGAFLGKPSGKSSGGSKRRDTVQKSIPYERVYADTNKTGGVIETLPGVFTKSYFIEDTSYSDCGDAEQLNILDLFEGFLNTFSSDCGYEITINNKNVDKNKFNQEILMHGKGDGFDDLRTENNEMYLSAMQEGKNNIRCEKYFTISMEAIDIKDAQHKFSSMETELNIKMKRINNNGLKAMTIEERLESLHDIFNLGNEGFLQQQKPIEKDGPVAKAFDLVAIRRAGMKTKDVIAPSLLDFSPKDYMMIGEKYARVLYLKTIPSQLKSTFLESLASISTNLVVSTYYEPVAQEKAASFASMQVTNIGGDVIKAQKSLAKVGIASSELISPKLQTAQRDAAEMLDDITNNNKRLFHVTVLVLVFADNKDDLKIYTEQVKTKAKGIICSMETLVREQERGLDAVLPLCCVHTVKELKKHIIMTSETASALQPFASKDLCHPNGIYYGINSQSKNIIMYNRMTAMNQNGVILGCPGGGKSFIAKSEMEQVFLNQPKSQIFIVDPEREYVVIAKKFGGQVIKIAPGATNHINPLDLDMTKDEDNKESSPLAEKIDFVISLIDCMLGPNQTLPSYARTIVDETLQRLYEPYLVYLRENNKTCDPDACPTLVDLFMALKNHGTDEGRQLAQSIQMFCTGSQNLFAFKTTVDANQRFVVYDISEIGTNLQDLGMQVCLSDIWNRMIRNKKKNIRTWFYLDEFYLMLRMKSSAAYLQMVWKRARKWMGVPTGLTQNVTDLLDDEYGRSILATSEFAIMLNQFPKDAEILSDLYDISPEQAQYFTNASPGHGIMKCGSVKVPFSNVFPEDTELFSIMSTKPADAAKLGITL